MAKKVLVVDDEKLIVKGIRFSLEQDGMEVDCAYDGEDHGTALGLQFLQDHFLFLFICRQKSFKAKPSRTESRQSQRRNACCRTRQRSDGNALLLAHPHQYFTGIGDRRGTGISDQRNVLSV